MSVNMGLSIYIFPKARRAVLNAFSIRANPEMRHTTYKNDFSILIFSNSWLLTTVLGFPVTHCSDSISSMKNH